MKALPLISVIIPTRNRAGDLRITLERVTADSYPRVEIFVYDDGSDEDIGFEMSRRFPQVQFLRSETRVGPCELRNRMIARARGEIIIGFDDDCSFDTPDAFRRIVEVFDSYPMLGLLSCRVRTSSGRLWPARRGRPLRETSVFISCGFAARRAALEAVGGFDPAIFRAGEERDLAIRLLDAGYEIRHTDDIVSDHRESPGDRDHQFIHAWALRNELLFVVRRVPALGVPWRLARSAAAHVRFCAGRGWWRALGRGLAGFLREAWPSFRRRRAVSPETWRRFLALAVEPAGTGEGDGMPASRCALESGV